MRLTCDRAGTEYARRKSEVFKESLIYRSDSLIVLVTPDVLYPILHVSLARVGGKPSGRDALVIAERFFGRGEFQAQAGTGDKVIHLWGRTDARTRNQHRQ